MVGRSNAHWSSDVCRISVFHGHRTGRHDRGPGRPIVCHHASYHDVDGRLVRGRALDPLKVVAVLTAIFGTMIALGENVEDIAPHALPGRYVYVFGNALCLIVQRFFR